MGSTSPACSDPDQPDLDTTDGTTDTPGESGDEDLLPSTHNDVHPAYPEALSSFGAAVVDSQLYVYSGHIGATHEHSKDNLSLAFRSLDLDDSDATWRSLSFRAPVQSASLVAYDGDLYRIGGMTAYNELDDEQEALESVTAFERYSPPLDTWTELAPLPQGRSSHDAVVVGSTLYVFGGWYLAPDDPESGTFYDHGLQIDLSDQSATWETIDQPFLRRAMCVATDGARVYIVGGMDQTHQGSLHTDVYEIADQTWLVGPEAPGGDPFGAFGCSSFGVDGEVYLTVNNGLIYRLDPENQLWQEVGRTIEPRYFTRMVPHQSESLLLVAGVAPMGDHLADIEVLPLSPR